MIMGASKNGNSNQAASADQLESFATNMLPGADILKSRMAGDKLAEFSGVPSIADASSKVKYSPEQPTKTPGSQYLSQGARPFA